MSKFSTTDIGQSVDLDVESVESKGDIVTPSDIYCNTINALYFNIGGLSITGSLYVPDGTVSLPSYSFTNSTNTGLYLLTSPSTSINFSVSGSNKLQISNTATTLTTPLFLPLGGPSTTSINFGTAGTGIYGSASQILFSTSTISRFDISTTNITSTLPFLAPAGSVIAPGYSFSTSTNTGLYHTTNELNIACSGFNVAKFKNSSFGDYPLLITANESNINDGIPLFRAITNDVSNMLETSINYYGTSILNWRMELGVSQNGIGFINFNPSCRQMILSNTTNTSTSPSYSFLSDPDTGIYNPSANNLGFSTNTTLRMTISTTAITSTLPISIPRGTSALPGLYFSTDTDTGIFSSGDGNVGIVGNTVNLMNFNTTEITFNRDFIPGTLLCSVGSTTFPVYKFIGRIAAANDPTYSFTNDLDTGIYSAGADNINFSTNALLRMTISTTAITSTLPIILTNQTIEARTVGNGGGGYKLLTSAGSLRWWIDMNNEIAGLTNAKLFLNYYNDSGTFINSYSFDRSGQLRFLQGGTQGAPNISIGNADTGFYGSGNEIYFTSAGSHRMTFNSTGINMLLGSNTNPSISFFGDTDTGIYSNGGGDLSFTTNSARCCSFNDFGQLALPRSHNLAPSTTEGIQSGTYSFTTGSASSWTVNPSALYTLSWYKVGKVVHATVNFTGTANALTTVNVDVFIPLGTMTVNNCSGTVTDGYANLKVTYTASDRVSIFGYNPRSLAASGTFFGTFTYLLA